MGFSFQTVKQKKFFLIRKMSNRALIEPEKPQLFTIKSFTEKVP